MRQQANKRARVNISRISQSALCAPICAFVWWWAKGGGLSLILGSQTPNTGAARVLCGAVLCFDSFCVLLSFSVIFMMTLSLSRAALSGLVI